MATENRLDHPIFPFGNFLHNRPCALQETNFYYFYRTTDLKISVCQNCLQPLLFCSRNTIDGVPSTQNKLEQVRENSPGQGLDRRLYPYSLSSTQHCWTMVETSCLLVSLPLVPLLHISHTHAMLGELQWPIPEAPSLVIHKFYWT